MLSKKKNFYKRHYIPDNNRYYAQDNNRHCVKNRNIHYYKGVTVKFIPYNRNYTNYITPKYSYTYNGVPGGWFI
jgi:hypothetical protein